MRDSMPVARNRVRASAVALPPPEPLPVLEVDQFVLEEAVVDDGEPAAGHEPSRREGGGAELFGPSLGHQAAFDHGEGTFGVRRRPPVRAAGGAPAAGGPSTG